MPKKKKFGWKEFFFGRKLTKEDYFKDRLRMCVSTGLRPADVSNFWQGIEELKLKYCANCGEKLSKRTVKIAKALGASSIDCKKCFGANLHKDYFA